MSRRLSVLPQPAHRSAIYVRISKDEGGDELGVRRQEKLCRELAKQIGWTVADVYPDDNLSAFKRRKGKRLLRPQFERLLSDIRAGRIDSLLTYNPDRLCRDDLRGIEDLIDVLNQFDVAVATVRAGEFDLSTSHGRAQARMAGVWARLESEKMSERITDKHAELAEDGKPNGGRRPMGFENDRVTVRESEATIVREIVDRVAAGETMTRIADSLNTRGVPTSTGARWTISMIRRIATNPRYVGRRIHKGEDVGPAGWAAIVDEATWRRAVAVLRDPSRPQRRSARRYLLGGGLIFCGAPGCGQPLRSKPLHARSGPVPVYACRPRAQGGCGGVTIRAEAVEELVRAAVIEIVESPEFARELRATEGGERKAAASNVNRLRAELDEMIEDYNTGAISYREYKKMKAPLEARLADAEEHMTADTTAVAVGRFAGRAGALAKWWDDPDTTLDARQAVVRAVIARVVVAPVGKHGNRFDPARVTVERLR